MLRLTELDPVGPRTGRPAAEVELPQHLGHGQASVADPVLLLVGQLRHRAAVRKQEDRVIAEAALPSRVTADAPLAAAQEDLAGGLARSSQRSPPDAGPAPAGLALHPPPRAPA